jgi:hypothetical protein
VITNRQAALIAGSIAALRQQGSTSTSSYQPIDPTLHYAEKYLKWLEESE